jgi:hypothetical protein
MGIDQIGGKGPPAPPVGETVRRGAAANETGGAGGVSNAGAPTAPFPAGSETPAAAAATAVGVDATSLQRLRSGELTLDGYLDAKVAEATGHLQGVAPAVLQAIRDALREQLASDPGLADLVRTVRGSAPPDEAERT